MVQYHSPVKRVQRGSGGRKRPHSDKRLAQYGGFFARGKFDKESKEEKRENRRVRGGGTKTAAKVILFANVNEAGKTSKVKIVAVKENPGDRHYARENLITRGAVVELEGGRMARITSRPGQSGVVSAVLIKKA